MIIKEYKKPSKRSKFNSQKKEVDGIIFDSTKEANFYLKLKILEKAGVITQIKLQPKFKYQITYFSKNSECYKSGFYKADFQVTYKNGNIEIIDVKGFKTKEFKRKKKIIENLYDIKIIII